MNNCGLILLAGGASTRLKRPKQLLFYRGKSLLQHGIRNAIQSIADPVVVVLGAFESEIKRETGNSRAYVIHNAGWAEGLGSSIRNGLSALISIAPACKRVILMPCDQPFISPDLLNSMIKLGMNSDIDIVACSYSDTIGIPVLFSKKYFPELLQLKGKQGAKSILEKNAGHITTIPFSLGKVDIDTAQEYEELIRSSALFLPEVSK